MGYKHLIFMALIFPFLLSCSQGEEMGPAPVGQRPVLEKLAEAYEKIAQQVEGNPRRLPPDERLRFVRFVFEEAGYDYEATLRSMASAPLNPMDTLQRDMAELLLLPHRAGGWVKPESVYPKTDLEAVNRLEEVFFAKSLTFHSPKPMLISKITNANREAENGLLNMRGVDRKRRSKRAWPWALAACSSLMAVPLAPAAPPVPFDNWNANPDGSVAAPCPTGYTCEVNVTGTGILQRLITSPSGRRYIQLIVDSQTPSGELREESFVRADNAPENGIASKQVLTSTGSAGENLTSSVLINTGWAMDPGQAAVQIDQTLVDTTPEGVQFNQVFQKLIDQDANGLAIGYYMNIRQDVINSTLLNGVSLGPNETGTWETR